MKITRVVANNMFQHEKLDIAIKGALIGVIGPNGSGKSNLLNLIRYAFSGEVPGKNKDQLLKWGSKASGDVKVYFKHNGHDGSVMRTVPAGKIEFIYGDHVRATGATAVAEALQANLGIDKSIVQLMFIPQGELDAILFDQPSKRELAFQNMCGIGDAAKIHKRLGEVITDKFPPLPNYDEQIAIATQQSEQYKREEQGFTREINNLMGQINLLPSDEELNNSRANFQRVCMAVERLIELERQQASAQANIVADEPTATELQQATAGIELAQIDASLAEANAQWQAAIGYQSVKKTYDQAVAAAAGLQPCPITSEQLATMQTAVDGLQATVGNINGTKKLYSELYTAIRSNTAQVTECPLCGSAVTDVEALKLRLSVKLNDLQKILTEASVKGGAAYTELKTASSTLANHQGMSRAVQQRLQEAERLIKSVAAVDADSALLEERIKAITEVRKDMVNLFQRKSSVEARLDANKRQLASILDTMAPIRIVAKEDPQFSGMPLDLALRSVKERLAAADSSLRAGQAVRVQLAGYQGRLGQLQAALKNLESTLQDLARRRGQQDTYNQVVTTLINVRDSMHYSALPHTLAVHVMTELSDATCAFLERLNAPFRVRTSTTDLSFQCIFIDGRVTPDNGVDAAVLSGGQKAMLAIAFRFASLAMFATKIGLTSLDEPTNYLDDANVANFASLLSRVKEVAQNLDLQVLMSTHERTLIPSFDQVIDLTGE